MTKDAISFSGTLLELLDMELIEATPDRVRLRMPVSPKVRQPDGLLHGGATVALAESAASIGAALCVGDATRAAVGTEINASHLRAVREGAVTAVATPLHLGRSLMVWAVEVRDQRDRLVCAARCTLAVVSSA